MGEVNLFGQMAVFIKVHFIKAQWMDKEYLLIKMVVFIKERLSKIKNKEAENKKLQKELILAILKIITKMVEVNLFIQMELFIEVVLKMVNLMVKEF